MTGLDFMLMCVGCSTCIVSLGLAFRLVRSVSSGGSGKKEAPSRFETVLDQPTTDLEGRLHEFQTTRFGAGTVPVIPPRRMVARQPLEPVMPHQEQRSPRKGSGP